jgi:hypothetical protein
MNRVAFRGLRGVGLALALAPAALGQEIMPGPQLAQALGGEPPSSSSRLSYVKVAPCRIIDTRLAGGSLAPAAPRAFRVTGIDFTGQGGAAAGCNVPFGPAAAALINFVAVNPVGAGNLRAWSYEDPIPTASILNYTSGFNIANAVVVPICGLPIGSCPSDFRVQADVSGAHLVADVLGYFIKAPPTIFVQNPGADTLTPLGTGCTHATGAEMTVTVAAPGKLLVQAQAKLFISHTGGMTDSVQTFIGASASDCTHEEGTHYLEIPPGLGSSNYFVFGPTSAVFSLPAAGTYTFYVNGLKTGGNNPALGGQARMTAVFTPN